jgi:hypothetical protein
MQPAIHQCIFLSKKQCINPFSFTISTYVWDIEKIQFHIFTKLTAALCISLFYFSKKPRQLFVRVLNSHYR